MTTKKAPKKLKVEDFSDFEEKVEASSLPKQQFGDPEIFKILSSEWNVESKQTTTTAAMEIVGLGVVVRVSTCHENNIAEALTFVPGAKLAGFGENRKIIKIEK